MEFCFENLSLISLFLEYFADFVVEFSQSNGKQQDQNFKRTEDFHELPAHEPKDFDIQIDP